MGICGGRRTQLVEYLMEMSMSTLSNSEQCRTNKKLSSQNPFLEDIVVHTYFCK